MADVDQNAPPPEGKGRRREPEPETEAAAAPAEAPAAFPGWIVGVTLGLMALGLVASVAMALFRPDPPPPPETEPAPEETEVPAAIRTPHPESTFAELQNALALAEEMPEQRIQAALNMVEFLLGAVDWRPEAERQRMAREYLLALAATNLEARQRFRVARLLFDLAMVLHDAELMASGEALLRAEPVGEEPIPIDLLCAETDALLELGDPSEALVRVNELGPRTEGPDGTWPYLVRMARLLRRALEDGKTLEAVWAQRTTDGSKPDREAILAELAERSAALGTSGRTSIEAEGLWNQAFLAQERGEKEAEIDALQQIIAKGISTFRPMAYIRLVELLREQGRDAEHAVALGRMIGRPELRQHAMSELQRRLRSPATTEVAQELLLAVDQVVAQGEALAQPLAQLLLAAGQMAVWQGWLPIAEKYLDQAESLTLDRILLADSMVVRAEIAEARQDRNAMVDYYKEVISLHPGHPKEADIRFLLLQEMAAQPFCEADLVGGIIGAVTRLPKDSRGIRGLIMVGRHLEDLKLYDLAETYYRLSVLLGTMQQVRETDGSTAEALLGQARAMAAQGKTVEADSLLRVINTNVRWADLWNSAGPLWATLAFRQGQFREGIRRWRHTCGPPGGEFLPHLFQLLVPDLGEWPAEADGGTAPKKPARMPREMVETAMEAAMTQLLEQNDFVGVERLLALAENDPEWGKSLPLNPYRMRSMEKMAAKESLGQTVEWMKRHPLQVTAAETSSPDLLKTIDDVQAVLERVRALPR